MIFTKTMMGVAIALAIDIHTFWTWWDFLRFRAEKLFPGPHLFAGAAIVVLWAVSAALVPFMEKGEPPENVGGGKFHGLGCAPPNPQKYTLAN